MCETVVLMDRMPIQCIWANLMSHQLAVRSDGWAELSLMSMAYQNCYNAWFFVPKRNITFGSSFFIFFIFPSSLCILYIFQLWGIIRTNDFAASSHFCFSFLSNKYKVTGRNTNTFSSPSYPKSMCFYLSALVLDKPAIDKAVSALLQALRWMIIRCDI